jgi:hypothetical protein
MIPIPDRVVERALQHRVPEGRCLVSTYSTGSHGYSQIGWQEDGQRKMTLIHLVVWQHYRGEIPKGMDVDHICRNRRCSRLAHLRLLSISQNRSQQAFHLRTCCPHGHPYDAENTRITRNGWRACRTCEREHCRRQRAARRRGG